MAFDFANMKMYLSGGASNTDVAASIGGAISSTEVTDDTLNNLFDTLSTLENANGHVDYRCVYIKNTNLTDEFLYEAALYIASQTVDANLDIEVGLEAGAINATAQTIADDETAPTGVTFSSPADGGTELAIGDMDGGDYKAIWFKRTSEVGSSSSGAFNFVIGIEGLALSNTLAEYNFESGSFPAEFTLGGDVNPTIVTRADSGASPATAKAARVGFCVLDDVSQFTFDVDVPAAGATLQFRYEFVGTDITGDFKVYDEASVLLNTDDTTVGFIDQSLDLDTEGTRTIKFEYTHKSASGQSTTGVYISEIDVIDDGA